MIYRYESHILRLQDVEKVLKTYNDTDWRLVQMFAREEFFLLVFMREVTESSTGNKPVYTPGLGNGLKADKFTPKVEPVIIKKKEVAGSLRHLPEPELDAVYGVAVSVAAKPEPIRTEGQGVEAKHGCPECGAYMVERDGRYGPFWGCSNYPQCTGKRKR